MLCLTQLCANCDIPTKMFLLNEIASISNVKANFEIETRLKPAEVDDNNNNRQSTFQKRSIRSDGFVIRLKDVPKDPHNCTVGLDFCKFNLLCKCDTIDTRR